MGGHYERGLFAQLMEVQQRLEAMETEHRKDRREIKTLREEVGRVRGENEKLREELGRVKEENVLLRTENEALRKENRLLREDNERMKRILSNNSSNSSMPPSSDTQTKPPNMYNSRKKTGKSAGGQKGHKGSHLSKAEVEKKIADGIYEHRIEEIGTAGRAYVTRYRLDLEVRTIATEIRIYADENGNSRGILRREYQGNRRISLQRRGGVKRPDLQLHQFSVRGSLAPVNGECIWFLSGFWGEMCGNSP